MEQKEKDKKKIILNMRHYRNYSLKIITLNYFNVIYYIDI